MKKTIYVEPQTDVIWLTAFDNVLTGTGNAPSISEDSILRIGNTRSTCSKKELNVEENTPSTGKQIITATVNVSTKVTYSENTPGGGGGISSVWAAGDKFYAIQDGTTVVTFNIVSGVGNTTATFEAEAEGVTASTTWKAVLVGHASVHGTEIHCGYTDQGGLSYNGVFLPGHNARRGNDEFQPKGWDQACIWSADQFQRNQGGTSYDCAYLVGSTNNHGSADWWRSNMKREWGLQIRPVLASSTISVSYRAK